MAQFPKIDALRFTWKKLVTIVVVVVVGLIVLDGLISVPPGHVGIIFDRGRGVLADELPEGLHLKIPFWQVGHIIAKSI